MRKGAAEDCAGAVIATCSSNNSWPSGSGATVGPSSISTIPPTGAVTAVVNRSSAVGAPPVDAVPPSGVGSVPPTSYRARATSTYRVSWVSKPRTMTVRMPSLEVSSRSPLVSDAELPGGCQPGGSGSGTSPSTTNAEHWEVFEHEKETGWSESTATGPDAGETVPDGGTNGGGSTSRRTFTTTGAAAPPMKEAPPPYATSGTGPGPTADRITDGSGVDTTAGSSGAEPSGNGTVRST